MNERIDEIAFETGCHRHKYWDPKNPDLDGFIISQATLDKFAVLIVKEVVEECATICVQHAGWTPRMIAEQVTQHFGVHE